MRGPCWTPAYFEFSDDFYLQSHCSKLDKIELSLQCSTELLFNCLPCCSCSIWEGQARRVKLKDALFRSSKENKNLPFATGAN